MCCRATTNPRSHPNPNPSPKPKPKPKLEPEPCPKPKPKPHQVLPSDVVAIVPANNTRVQALVNATFAPYKALASSFGALLEVAKTVSAGEPLLLEP
jgi:outer membrane biosynthesis protein TonB